MADNCKLPKISGRLNLPYQAFAFPKIVPSAPIKIDMLIAMKEKDHAHLSRTESDQLPLFRPILK